MKKSCVTLTAVLLANSILGTDGIEYLKGSHIFSSVRVTSTNLVLKCKPLPQLNILHDRDFYNTRGTSEYMDKDLILTPDRRTIISDLRHGSLTFTPVVFKNKREGFRLVEVWNGMSFGQGITTNAIAYVALSDKPIKVSEKDVEMIMEERRDYETGEFVKEWKPFEREGGAQVSLPADRQVLPSREKKKNAINVAEDGQDEEKSNASNLWLYIVIALCTLSAVLWVVKRKS